MAGHSQFANIKHRKNAQDSKRSKIFVKIAKEIKIAVQNGGPSIDTNPSLRTIISKAKALNMPKENYLKIINKSFADKNSQNYEKIIYEGYGPNKIAILVEAVTNNKNRTASIVREAFSKSNITLSSSNSVKFLFNLEGVLSFENNHFSDEKILEILIETEVENFTNNDNTYTLYINPKKIELTKKGLAKLNIINFNEDYIAFIPYEYLNIQDQEITSKINNFINNLLKYDDILEIYTNIKN